MEVGRVPFHVPCQKRGIVVGSKVRREITRVRVRLQAECRYWQWAERHAIQASVRFRLCFLAINAFWRAFLLDEDLRHWMTRIESDKAWFVS